MNLKSKVVTINGEEYEVREITVGKMLPILPRMNNEEEQQEAQLDLMRDCVYVNGKPVGDAVTELGISTYLKLAEVVMEVNGLSEGKG